MVHLHLKGKPYEAGFKWGKRLYDHGIKLLDQIPFILDEERKDFAAVCHPFYQQYYPGVVEEIRGIADGQGIAFEDLTAVLYSMYCIMPDQKCTCFIMKNDREYLLCRNSDFLTSLEKLYANVIYQMEGCYAFQGNTTAFVEIEDGMNDRRLAIGLTSVYPQTISPGLNAGMLVRYLLEHCRSTKEALEQLKLLPIASAQVLMMIDAFGHGAVVECDCESMHVRENGCLAAVNAFTSDALKHKRNTAVDDWQADVRYDTVVGALRQLPTSSLQAYGKAVLAGKHGFLCQYERAFGKDTVWSVIYDTRNNEILRCEGNPSRRSFRADNRMLHQNNNR